MQHSFVHSKTVPLLYYEYGLEGVSVSRPNTFNDLGLTLVASYTLCHTFIKCVLPENLLFRNRRDLSHDTLKLLFSTFISCRLDYAFIVWSPII